MSLNEFTLEAQNEVLKLDRSKVFLEIERIKKLLF